MEARIGNMNDALKKGYKMKWEVQLEKNKKIQTLISEFLEELFRIAKIENSEAGGYIVKELVDEKVIKPMDISKYVELNNNTLTKEEINILMRNYRIKPCNTHTVTIEVRADDLEDILLFRRAYACEMKGEYNEN